MELTKTEKLKCLKRLAWDCAVSEDALLDVGAPPEVIRSALNPQLAEVG